MTPVSEWERVKLGDVTDLLTGYPFRSAEYTSSPRGIRLLRGDNVVQGALRWSGVKRWPRDRMNSYDRYLLRENDVVLAMDRPWIEAGLKWAAIRAADLPALLVQRVARLRGGPDLDPLFLRYVVGSAEFTNHVLAVQTGTAVPHISGDQIRSFAFNCPPLAEQRQIGEVLSELDDKIELNRTTDDTIGLIAQTLFKSWFVDFDPILRTSTVPEDIRRLFPDRLVDSPIGPVPEGWNAAEVSVLLLVSREAIDPRENPDEEFDHFSIPAFDAGRVPSVEVGHAIKSVKLHVPADCVLLSKLNPRVPRIWWPQPPGSRRRIASTEFVICLPRAPITRAYLYGLFTSATFQTALTSLVRGTSGSHQRVSIADLLKIPVIHPPVEVVARFDDLNAPMFALSDSLLTESKTLAEVRDALIPKLMSGEIRLPVRAA